MLTFYTVNGQSSQYHMLDYRWQNDSLVVNESKSHNLNFEFEFSDYVSDFEIRVLNPVYVACSSSEKKYLKNLFIDSIPQINYVSGISRKKLIIRGEIFPFIKHDEVYQKLVFAEVDVKFSNQPSARKSSSSVDNSVLSSGNWYKIGVNADGIYRLSYQDLEELGMNVSSLNPQNLSIYGHPGGLLPNDNASERTVDLEELAIQVVGQSDGSFDANDYILFYGQSPNQWSLNSSGFFSRQQHYFDNYTYYFITADLGEGKRLSNVQSLPNADITISTFDDYQIHENEEVNFIKSGKNWYGDVFDLVDSRTFNFNFPNRVGPANLKMILASNSPSPL